MAQTWQIINTYTQIRQFTFLYVGQTNNLRHTLELPLHYTPKPIDSSSDFRSHFCLNLSVFPSLAFIFSLCSFFLHFFPILFLHYTPHSVLFFSRPGCCSGRRPVVKLCTPFPFWQRKGEIFVFLFCIFWSRKWIQQ